MAMQAVLLAAAIVSGHWWVYPVLWVAPYLTVWRVINRLRSIAEHGGMQMSTDRRQTTHSVAQSRPARFALVPYNIGWHLAHHVDSGIPFRNLPRLHRMLHESGYVDDTIEYPSYSALWRALGIGPTRARDPVSADARREATDMVAMHRWDDATELFAHSVIGYAIERIRLPKDPRWGSQPAEVLDAAIAHAISPKGAGAHEALRLARDVLIPACRPMDDPMNLAYVPDRAHGRGDDVRSGRQRVVDLRRSLGGRGRRDRRREPGAALAGRPGRVPAQAGGVFVSGGSAANLSALVTARAAHLERHGRRGRLAFAATTEVHASVRADGTCDGRRHRDGRGRRARPNDRRRARSMRCTTNDQSDEPLDVFAVVASAGTTNAGAIDRLDEVADSLRAARPVAARRRRLRTGRVVLARRSAAAGCGRSAPTASVSIRTSGCSRRTTAPRWCTAIPACRSRPRAARRLPRCGRPQRVEPGRLRVPPVASRSRPAAVVLAGHVRHRCVRRGARHHAADRAGVRPVGPATDPSSSCCSSPSCRSCCSAVVVGRPTSTTQWSTVGPELASP